MRTYDDCKKKPVFSRTIMYSQNFAMAGKSKRMASNPGQVLKSHQEFIGKIEKNGPGSLRQHSWLRNIRNSCNIPDLTSRMKKMASLSIIESDGSL